MWYVNSKLQPGIYIASAKLLRAGDLLFDLILPLNLLPWCVLASCVPQPCACLSCNPQTRKKQANSSLSKSSSARGRKENLQQTVRKPNWSPATPSAISAMAPFPPMKSQTVVWGKCLRLCCPCWVVASSMVLFTKCVHFCSSSKNDAHSRRPQGLASCIHYLSGTCAGLQKRNPRVKQKLIWIQLCDLAELHDKHLSRGTNGICVLKTGRGETWAGCFITYFIIKSITYFSVRGSISGLGQTNPLSVYPILFLHCNWGQQMGCFYSDLLWV